MSGMLKPAVAALALVAVVAAPGAGASPSPSLQYELNRASDLPAARAGSELVTLDDGRVLVIGGDSGPTTALVYDPGTGVSVPTGAMAREESLAFSSAIKLSDERVLVISDAMPVDVPAYSVAQVFDPFYKRSSANRLHRGGRRSRRDA